MVLINSDQMMEAGRELDVLVAEKPMGYSTDQLRSMPISCPDNQPGCLVIHSDLHFPNGVPLPHYSTDIAAAWQVISKMEADGWSWNLQRTSKEVICHFSREDWILSVVIPNARASTPAHAICLAALKAAEV